MTDQRPTPEQIEEDVIRRSAEQCLEPCVLQALRECGYVIVHPDDVPGAMEDRPWSGETSWLNGWDDCRDFIFGDDA